MQGMPVALVRPTKLAHCTEGVGRDLVLRRLTATDEGDHAMKVLNLPGDGVIDDAQAAVRVLQRGRTLDRRPCFIRATCVKILGETCELVLQDQYRELSRPHQCDRHQPGVRGAR